MNVFQLLREAAKLYAAIVVKQDPNESFDEHTFPGHEVGLPKGEYVIVQYRRRKIEGLEHDKGTSMSPEIRYTRLDE